jgi:hypothetical protein
MLLEVVLGNWTLQLMHRSGKIYSLLLQRTLKKERRSHRNARDGFGELDFTVSAEVRANLQSASSANTEEKAEVTPESWYTTYKYSNVLAE